MEDKVLNIIFSSDKIHLTSSQKNFIKETFSILSIFSPEIKHIFLKKFNECIKTTKNKFYAGDKFFEIVCNLRYPVSYKRICSLKQFKKQNLEFDETLIENFPQKLKHLLHKI